MPLPSWETPLALAVLLTLPGTVELLLVCYGTVLAALSKDDRASRAIPQAFGRLIVVVPAHNEASGIAATLSSLLAADPASSFASIVVVADNCSDDTAGIARAAGVRVIERLSDNHRGKGYALDFAFRTLANSFLRMGHCGILVKSLTGFLYPCAEAMWDCLWAWVGKADSQSGNVHG